MSVKKITSIDMIYEDKYVWKRKENNAKHMKEMIVPNHSANDMVIRNENEEVHQEYVLIYSGLPR